MSSEQYKSVERAVKAMADYSEIYGTDSEASKKSVTSEQAAIRRLFELIYERFLAQGGPFRKLDKEEAELIFGEMDVWKVAIPTKEGFFKTTGEGFASLWNNVKFELLADDEDRDIVRKAVVASRNRAPKRSSGENDDAMVKRPRSQAEDM